LRHDDLDMDECRVRIEQSKGLKDRVVLLAAVTVEALRAYLEVRGQATTDHVFAYRHRPLSSAYCRKRIETYGRRCGVQVKPHQLRHSCATPLLNAGAPILAIQKLLGHKRLNTTMIYARAHDHTVAKDYYTAMAKIERRLDPDAEQVPVARAGNAGEPVSIGERARLLALLDRLTEPQLDLEVRLALVAQMRSVLNLAESPTPAGDPWQTAVDTAA
jgi:hypothetical protein